VCTMCAPRDQRKSSNNQREQAEVNALHYRKLLASTDLDEAKRKTVEGLLGIEEEKLLQIESERTAKSRPAVLFRRLTTRRPGAVALTIRLRPGFDRRDQLRRKMSG
jgi:hypothetical protein